MSQTLVDFGNRVRLSMYAPHRGVKTEVNGVELREVRNISLECPVDGLPVLRIEQFVHPDLDVTLNCVVEPTVLILTDEYDLVVEKTGTTTRYRASRREND